jgi:hypothetical protein
MSSTQPNPRAYFQHETLTKIRGQPVNENLTKMEKEVCANGKTARTTLGGGNQGHLGMVCSDATYERVSPGVPFVRPLLPVRGDLTGTAAQIAANMQVYEDQLEQFNTCNLVERTIIQQIYETIEHDYLVDMIDVHTGLLVGTIPEIFANLFQAFGQITPQELADVKKEVEAINYEHGIHIMKIFTAINEYARKAEFAGVFETTPHLINMGLVIITRANIFAVDIRAWNKKPNNEKTWPNFIEHFKTAQREIKYSQPAITTDVLGLHGQANAATIEQIIDGLINAQQQQQQNREIQQHHEHMAYATQQNQNLEEQLQALQMVVSTLQSQGNNQIQGRGGGGRGRGSGRGGRGNGQEGQGSRTGRGNSQRPSRQYCWTHGNCGHIGAGCHTKAEGHVDQATYQNRQGGSTYGCYWL